MQKSNYRFKRHGSDWLQDALYILSTKKSTDKNTASVIRWRHADARHSLRCLSTIQLTVISFHMAPTLSDCWLNMSSYPRVLLIWFCWQCMWCVFMMCTHHHVEQMFAFTTLFRQDYCAIPFPFDSPYYSDRDRDQCFNCFLIPPDWKDSASRLLTLITWWLDKVV